MRTEVGKDFKEPTESRIFLDAVSCVDHAYIDSTGAIVGGSYHPNFIVSGKPDPVEKVVVDFSTIKKDIKTAIDKHEPNIYTNGFDHKLWIIEGLSNVIRLDFLNGGEQVIIETPIVTLRAPTDAVKYISTKHYTVTSFIDTIGQAFQSHILNTLDVKYPKVGIDVQCNNTAFPHLPLQHNPYRTFRYTHGLKDSTSYGCQNVAHGHLSFIQLFGDNVSYDDNDELCSIIARELDNTMFVRKENAITTGTLFTVVYTTDRGTFRLDVDTDAMKVVVLPTETTVEFLAAYVVHQFGDKLKRAGVKQVFISEGLSKGAIENVK